MFGAGKSRNSLPGKIRKVSRHRNFCDVRVLKDTRSVVFALLLKAEVLHGEGVDHKMEMKPIMKMHRTSATLNLISPQPVICSCRGPAF